MKLILAIIAIILLSGCAMTRAKGWAWLSDKADELDGSDDVPSVIFETDKDINDEKAKTRNPN